MHDKDRISTPKSTSNEELTDKYSIPNKSTKSGRPPKAVCSDPSHGERKLREGEKVYAILNHEDEVTVESIACIQCSAQHIYERADKNVKLSIVAATLSTESLDDTAEDLNIKNISVLDTFTP